MQALLCLALSNAALATLLAVLAAVVARICRRPVVRHALWMLVLLKLITPPLLPLSLAWHRSEENEPPQTELPQAVVIIPSESNSSDPIPLESGRDARAPEPERSERGAGAAEHGSPARNFESPASVPPIVVSCVPALIVVWFGGTLASWFVVALRLGQFQRLLRQTRPAPAEVQEQARKLATLLGLRHSPPIIFVSAPLSPMLWALGLSQRLLVPVELWRKLTAEQQDTLLAHELAHLRRGDHWVRRLELLVLGMYWWHPVVWWA